MANDRDGEREMESRRILERVSREAESGGRSVVERAARRARDHVSAVDADQGDWAEHWGTRIGRALGIVIVAGLVFWLIFLVVRGE